MARPSLVRTGMFCKFGSSDQSRPVVVAARAWGGGRLGMEGWGRGVGMGVLEFGEQPPVENLARQLMALRGKLLERASIGAPGAGLGAPPARQAHFVEQDLAELLRRADIEVLAG